MAPYDAPYKHHPITLPRDVLTPPSLQRLLDDPTILAITSAFTVDVQDGCAITLIWDLAPNVRTTNGTDTSILTSFEALTAHPNTALIPTLFDHQYGLRNNKALTNALRNAWLSYGPHPEDTPSHVCVVAWTRWGVGVYSISFLDWAIDAKGALKSINDPDQNGWPLGGLLLSPAIAPASAHAKVAAQRDAQALERNWNAVLTSHPRHALFTAVPSTTV